MAIGLAPDKPVLLVAGGSQGASGINELMRQALPKLLQSAPQLQFLHLTGTKDFKNVSAIYAVHKCRAQVFSFLTEMELALGAATIAISRAGASSIAELAAMRVPSILVPYPAATDNHQFYNAQALVHIGAARLLEQKTATPDGLVQVVIELLRSELIRQEMSMALDRWHVPNAAEEIASRLLQRVGMQSANAHQPGNSNTSLPRLRPEGSSDQGRHLSLQSQTCSS